MAPRKNQPVEMNANELLNSVEKPLTSEDKLMNALDQNVDPFAAITSATPEEDEDIGAWGAYLPKLIPAGTQVRVVVKKATKRCAGSGNEYFSFNTEVTTGEYEGNRVEWFPGLVFNLGNAKQMRQVRTSMINMGFPKELLNARLLDDSGKVVYTEDQFKGLEFDVVVKVDQDLNNIDASTGKPYPAKNTIHYVLPRASTRTIEDLL